MLIEELGAIVGVQFHNGKGEPLQNAPKALLHRRLSASQDGHPLAPARRHVDQLQAMPILAQCALSSMMHQVGLEVSGLAGVPRDAFHRHLLSQLVRAFGPFARCLRSRRVMVASLICPNCCSTSAVNCTLPKRARCWAVSANTGVSRSAHTESRLSHTSRITCSTATPYVRLRAVVRFLRARLPACKSRSRLLRCRPVTCSISLSKRLRSARLACWYTCFLCCKYFRRSFTVIGSSIGSAMVALPSVPFLFEGSIPALVTFYMREHALLLT